ncbi:MAG: endonuclease/exonuclease/phosphatase family protein [Geminicoccaceae bacterium]
MANSRDISFATFNLYNLHLPGEQIYSDRDGWTNDEFERKLDWSARQLIEADADVIGFQECWRREALERIFERAGLADGYEILARDQDPATIQVALAARKGLIASEPLWIEAFPEDARFEELKEAREPHEMVSVTISQFSRPPLKVTIQPRGRRPKPPPITVYVAHFKSKGPTRLRRHANTPAVQDNHYGIAQSVVSHIRRIAEAGALRAILDTEMKGNDAPFVVMGDLNDGSLSISTELLSGDPGYRFFEKSRAGSRSDRGLYSVERLQQLRSLRHVYFTHIYKEKMESLDHILVSDAFYDHAANRLWSFREMTVVTDHLVLDSKRERSKIGANDHGIVRADFDWNPMSEVLDEAPA